MKKTYIALLLFTTLLITNTYRLGYVSANSYSSRSEQAQDYFNSYNVIFNRMKEAMNAAPNTWNVDLDFVLEMMPHHEGAIAMTKNILNYTQNVKLKELSENIVTTQSKGVNEMKELLKTIK